MQIKTVLNEVGISVGITSAVIGISVVFAIFWVSLRIALPIKELDSQLKSQHIGKKLRNIEIKRNRIDKDDEINEVIYTINSMINQINELERKKEDTLAIISHELRTPLASMLGFSQILQKPEIQGQLNPTQTKAIKIINKNVVNLKVMIMDILDFQKLDLEKMSFQYAHVDITELFEKLMNNYKKYMDEKQIEFYSDSGKIFVTTDRERIEHVFDHLILNAVDFVPDKGGRIEIGSRIIEKNEVLFYVKDNGIGISVEKQEDLFKKSPPDETISRKHGGTGLGLAICKGIVEGLGGKIWVESEEGKGSVFYFVLPKEVKNE
jgi:signal transduction histidine kinase